MKPVCTYGAALAAACLALAGCSDRYQPDEADTAYGDARKAFDAGNFDQAMELVTKAIDNKPTAWAHALRARIYVEKKEFDKAQEDATQGLALDANNPELKWLDAELKKPPAQRFQGANKLAPGVTK